MVTSSKADDSKEFIEQARWLLERHSARSEAFVARAVALLGFVGVTLALLLQGSGLRGIDPSGWTWIYLVSAVVALLLCAIFALRTIAPKTKAMPQVSALRGWWAAHIAEPHPGTAGPQIAESLLNGQQIDQDSAVSAALEHADSCARSFTWSTRFMLIALALLSLLLINVLFSAWRG